MLGRVCAAMRTRRDDARTHRRKCRGIHPRQPRQDALPSQPAWPCGAPACGSFGTSAAATATPRRPPLLLHLSSFCLPASLASPPLLQSIELPPPFSLTLLLSRHLCTYYAAYYLAPPVSVGAVSAPKHARMFLVRSMRHSARSEYYTPTVRLAMWHALAGTRGLRGRERKRERERERETSLCTTPFLWFLFLIFCSSCQRTTLHTDLSCRGSAPTDHVGVTGEE